ncbi:DNA cytosine methyltransferase [Leifsonia sp. NPDC014704]|uniref:DNA cytosine methyltransferase n=1 Tax=Leifsonia sp. NPDC014704 TaxID=3364123 RepID=UPI0036F47497
MITMTDMFCGAGGSSSGAIQVPGVSVRIAANHWQTAIDIHNANHQGTDHAIVDLHLERPSYFPRTDIAWMSPECTKWSQANGAQLPAIEEGLFEDPLSDDVKQRSRLLMFDCLKFIEYHRYRLVIIENVVDIATQAKYRTAWTVWRQELRALGYNFRVVSLNSMHAQTFGAPAPQSRDRIYIVAWPEGQKGPDLDRILRPRAYCSKCDRVAESVQSFKAGRTVGRYRQAYVYCCPTCGSVVEPGWLPAAAAIDWSIPGERIGDRLKPKTRARIAAGIARYWGPLTLEAAGNTYDAADPAHPHYGELDAYYRAWPVEEALRALHTTNSKALAVPVEGRDGKDAWPADVPLRTQTTRAETGLAHAPFIAEMYGTSTARSVAEPAGTFTAGGNHHALVTRHYGVEGGSAARHTTPSEEPLRTLTANGGNMSLVHRHNDGGAEMTTPSSEYLRTLTTGGNVSLLQSRRPLSPDDLKAAEAMVPEVLFRMFRPHEVAAGMAFPSDYTWQPVDRLKPISNRDLVRAAGNAVTPPAARDLVAASVEIFE